LSLHSADGLSGPESGDGSRENPATRPRCIAYFEDRFQEHGRAWWIETLCRLMQHAQYCIDVTGTSLGSNDKAYYHLFQNSVEPVAEFHVLLVYGPGSVLRSL